MWLVSAKYAPRLYNDDRRRLPVRVGGAWDAGGGGGDHRDLRRHGDSREGLVKEFFKEMGRVIVAQVAAHPKTTLVLWGVSAVLEALWLWR